MTHISVVIWCTPHFIRRNLGGMDFYFECWIIDMTSCKHPCLWSLLFSHKSDFHRFSFVQSILDFPTYKVICPIASSYVVKNSQKFFKNCPAKLDCNRECTCIYLHAGKMWWSMKPCAKVKSDLVGIGCMLMNFEVDFADILHVFQAFLSLSLSCLTNLPISRIGSWLQKLILLTLCVFPSMSPPFQTFKKLANMQNF